MTPVELVVQRLSERGYKPAKRGSTYSSLCPGHDDRNPSLSVSEGRNGCALVKCHAGCVTEDIIAPLDLTMANLFVKMDISSGTKRTTIHPYVEDGKLLYEQVRHDFPDGSKKIWTRYPNGKKTSRRTLYRLDEMLRRDPPDRWVFITEGEKCVDRLVAEGFCATTVSHGAIDSKSKARKWRDVIARHLAGARVALLADNDEAGLAHVEYLAELAHGSADIVRVIKLPDLAPKGDVADWFDNGGSADELEKIVAATADWRPPSPPSDGEMPDLELDPEQAKTIEDLLEKLKDLDEKDQKSAMKALTQLLGKSSQATDLVSLALDAGVELWHDPEGNGYATIPVATHVEHWPIRSRAFRLWLRRRYYEEEESAPNANAVRDAIEILDGKALFTGDEHEIHVRVAAQRGAVYVDLCDDDWRCIEITATGWLVRTGAPVRFRRSKGMLALPVPESGYISELRRFVNVTDQEWPLVVGWLVGAFRPRGPYPVLEVTAEHGSAKSTLCRVLRRCIDPSKAALRAAPSDTRDLAIAANNGWICGFDNLSSLWPKLSDDLARLSTGAGFGTRKLYEDDEEQLFDACRPVLLNGIEDVITRPDLLDRAITLHPPRIDDRCRREEAEFWAAFEDALPHVLGGLLDAVACALALGGDVVLERPPRMADFARWVVAAEPELGIDDGAFLAAYQANREQAHALALEASEVTTAILEFARKEGDWYGAAGELAELLKPEKPPKGWPTSPRAMAGALKRAAPVLRHHGVDVHLEDRTSAGRRWRLTKRTEGGN
jgi:hypothetical protein